VLDNPAPASLAASIEKLVLAEDSTAPADLEPPGEEHPPGTFTAAGAGPELPADFESVYRMMCASGRAAAAWDMVGAAAGLRSMVTVDGGLEPWVTGGMRLVSGSQQPALVCFPAVVSLGGPAEYRNFAAPFSGMRDVFHVVQPGFRDGEPLPADLTVAAEVGARAVRQLVPSGPVVLCGRSFGGWIAHAAAERLAEAGDPPAGLILLDTFWPGEEFNRKFVPRTLRRLVDRQNDLGTDLGITRLTAIGWYLGLLARWRPERGTVPTLYLHPADQTPAEQHLRRHGWRLPHTAVAVTGDHFSILDQDASTTAEAIEAWLPTLGKRQR
jgi:thioesterase domain-containing protein